MFEHRGKVGLPMPDIGVLALAGHVAHALQDVDDVVDATSFHTYVI